MNKTIGFEPYCIEQTEKTNLPATTPVGYVAGNNLGHGRQCITQHQSPAVGRRPPETLLWLQVQTGRGFGRHPGHYQQLCMAKRWALPMVCFTLFYLTTVLIYTNH